MSSNMSLNVANYKVTAAQLGNIKTSMSWNSDDCNIGGLSSCNNNNMWVGDPNNWGWGTTGGSCPNCGCYVWGGTCGCTNAIPMPAPVPYPNVIPAVYPWSSGTNFLPKPLITKGKQKCDILGDFFGPEVHALVILDETDGGARFVPFMDKLNMIWLQETLNSWAAYDRDEFFEFVNSEDQTIFLGEKLSKDEVLKRMMKPEAPPENSNDTK